MNLECRYRNRIQIGNWTTLRSYQTDCPSCRKSFTLLFPVVFLTLAEHRVLDVLCPACRKEFFVLAGELTPTESLAPTAEVVFIR